MNFRCPFINPWRNLTRSRRFRQCKAAEGIGHFKEALRLKPDYVQARNNLRAAQRQERGKD